MQDFTLHKVIVYYRDMFPRYWPISRFHMLFFIQSWCQSILNTFAFCSEIPVGIRPSTTSTTLHNSFHKMILLAFIFFKFDIGLLFYLKKIFLNVTDFISLPRRERPWSLQTNRALDWWFYVPLILMLLVR